MKKKNMILLAGALAASMLIGGCSKEKTESETTGSPAQGEISNETQGTQIVEKGDEIVTMAITASWDTLNIYNTSGNYGNAVADQMFERLVTRTHDGEVLPRLAESWEMSEDNRSMTFKLAENALWHDGEKVTADDIVFTCKAMTLSLIHI